MPCELLLRSLRLEHVHLELRIQPPLKRQQLRIQFRVLKALVKALGQEARGCAVRDFSERATRAAELPVEVRGQDEPE